MAEPETTGAATPPVPTPPVPWVRFGDLALNGRRELGICRVELDRDVGLLRAESIGEDPPTVTYFSRGSVYAFLVMTEADARVAAARINAGAGDDYGDDREDDIPL